MEITGNRESGRRENKRMVRTGNREGEGQCQKRGGRERTREW